MYKDVMLSELGGVCECAAASQVMESEHMICGMGFSCILVCITYVHIRLAKECCNQSRYIVYSQWQIYNLAFLLMATMEPLNDSQIHQLTTAFIAVLKQSLRQQGDASSLQARRLKASFMHFIEWGMKCSLSFGQDAGLHSVSL